MNRAAIEEKKSRYVRMGKEALTAAQNYLTKNADAWDREHATEWQNMLNAAEVCLIKATALDELLEVTTK